MSKIRVLHVARPSDGGIKKHILTLIEYSDREIFDHMVACPPGAVTDTFKNRGIRTFTLPIKGSISVRPDIQAITILTCIIRENRLDIVHCHGYKAGLVGRAAALLAGVPAVVTIHNSIIFSTRDSLWKRKIYTTGEKIMSCFTDRYIAVSGDLACEIAFCNGINPGKVTVIYNGINHHHFETTPDRQYLERTTGITPGDRVVGTVARLTPQKGVDDFIKAAAILTSRLSGVSFLVVGGGPLREVLERQSRDLNLAGKLFFTGERRDIDMIMPCLDVFVLASVSEGLPLALLEAMAAGRPVVATRVGGVPEVLSDGVNGILLNPGDVEGLAGAIGSLIMNREIWSKMALAGRNRLLEGFTNEKMISSTEKVYTDLIHGSCS